MPTYHISAWRNLHAGFREPQKTSQAHTALASRAALSRRSSNQRTFTSVRDRSDSEILAASFKLSDAQEMVARQHGFSSWQALKLGISATPHSAKPRVSKVVIVAAEPQLFVTDIKRACEFFLEKLGFSLVFSYGDPPYYAQVGRDAARLNLRWVEEPVIGSTVRDHEGLLSASMTVATAEEIKLLFLEFQSAGVAFHQRLKKQPWGAKNFVVKVPDGNLLLFAGPAD